MLVVVPVVNAADWFSVGLCCGLAAAYVVVRLGRWRRDRARSYSEGGWLKPGRSVARNNNGRPEPVDRPQP